MAFTLISKLRSWAAGKRVEKVERDAAVYASTARSSNVLSVPDNGSAVKSKRLPNSQVADATPSVEDGTKFSRRGSQGQARLSRSSLTEPAAQVQLRNITESKSTGTFNKNVQQDNRTDFMEWPQQVPVRSPVTLPTPGPHAPGGYDVVICHSGINEEQQIVSYLAGKLRSSLSVLVSPDVQPVVRSTTGASSLPALPQARVYVVVMSANFQTSWTCMEELRLALDKQVVWPIYANTEPGAVYDVSLETALEDMFQHASSAARSSSKQQIKSQWLDTICQLQLLEHWSYDSATQNEAELVQSVYQRVLWELGTKLKAEAMTGGSVAPHLAAATSELKQLLDQEMADDVLVISIYSMSKSCRTQVAAALHDACILKEPFIPSCFLRDVRWRLQGIGDLEVLQQQMLRDLCDNPDADLPADPVQGRIWLRERLGAQPVLLVLDDVEEEHLAALLSGGVLSLPKGSRVIITSTVELTQPQFHKQQLPLPPPQSQTLARRLQYFTDQGSGNASQGFMSANEPISSAVLGRETIQMICTLLDASATAAPTIASNLRQLAELALAVQELLVAALPLQSQAAQAVYVAQFQDALQMALSYAHLYDREAKQQLLLHLIGFEQDEHFFSHVWGRLHSLTKQAAPARLTKYMKSAQGEPLTQLYKDPGLQIRELITGLGPPGHSLPEALTALRDYVHYDRVLAGLADAIHEMGASQQKLHRSTVSQVFEMYLDSGPMTQVAQLDLRLFWKQSFGSLLEVTWRSFWLRFPKWLAETGMDRTHRNTVTELKQQLSQKDNQRKFQQQVSWPERKGGAQVTVFELCQALNSDTDLASSVQRLLTGPRRDHGMDQLPFLDLLADFEVTADMLAVVNNLKYHGAIRLWCCDSSYQCAQAAVAGAVARRLGSEGALAHGARWVDLRQAKTEDDVYFSFSAALDLQTRFKDGDLPTQIVKAFADLCQAPPHGTAGGLLLVVDCAGNNLPSQSEAGKALEHLMTKVLHVRKQFAAQARVIIMSQQPLCSVMSWRTSAYGVVEARKRIAALHTEDQDSLRQLMVFPATFSAMDAASVLGISEPEARALLTVLLRRELLSSSSSHQTYAVPGSVQDVARSLPGPAGAGTQYAGSQQRFVARVMSQLKCHSDLYSTGSHALAAQLARRQSANLSLAAQLVLKDPTLYTEPAAEATVALSPELVAAASLQIPAQHLLQQHTKYLEGKQANVASKATAISRQAACLWDAGQFGEAEQLFRAAIQLTRELQLPTELATAISNLASCISDQSSSHKQAEPLHREVMHIRKFNLGAEHPDTATAIYNLAVCLARQRKHKGAERFYKEAFTTREERLGPDHPDTIKCVLGWAHSAGAQGCHAEAENLYRQAYDSNLGMLDAKHPDAIKALTQLACYLKSQGRYSDAEPLFQKAVDCCTDVLGSQHSHLLPLVNNLADCISMQGQHKRAETHFRHLKKYYSKVLGPQHLHTATATKALAECLLRQQRYQDAQPLFEKALSTMQDQLGVKHPDTISTSTKLRDCNA